MTVPRLLEIQEYWNHVPPLHEAFAAFVGALRPSGASHGREDTGHEADGNAMLETLMSAGIQMPPEVSAVLHQPSKPSKPSNEELAGA